MQIKFLQDLIFNGQAVKAGDVLAAAADKHTLYCLGRKLAVLVESETPAAAPAETVSKRSKRSAADKAEERNCQVPDDPDFLDGAEL